MENILFTRQFHQAEKAGDHYDYRLVVGDKAHSWATKKQLPEPGKSIILWEQPVHTADYALSERVEIPKGQYGAGTTTLDWVKRGKASFEDGKIVVNTDSGKFLIKKMPENYGEGAWLFKHLEKEKNMGNKYLEKIANTKNNKNNKNNKNIKSGILIGAGIGTGLGAAINSKKEIKNIGEEIKNNIGVAKYHKGSSIIWRKRYVEEGGVHGRGALKLLQLRQIDRLNAKDALNSAKNIRNTAGNRIFKSALRGTSKGLLVGGTIGGLLGYGKHLLSEKNK